MAEQLEQPKPYLPAKKDKVDIRIVSAREIIRQRLNLISDDDLEYIGTGLISIKKL